MHAIRALRRTWKAGLVAGLLGCAGAPQAATAAVVDLVLPSALELKVQSLDPIFWSLPSTVRLAPGRRNARGDLSGAIEPRLPSWHMFSDLAYWSESADGALSLV